MDAHQAAIALFMRLLQRDQSERPKIHAEPSTGVEWQVVIYIGEVPPKIAAHYSRQAAGAVSNASPRREGEADPDAMSKVGRGATVELALEQIIEELSLKLRQRAKADSEICDMVGREYRQGGIVVEAEFHGPAGTSTSRTLATRRDR
jgi:hypothetical protein